MGALNKAALLDKRREKVELQGGYVYVATLGVETFYDLMEVIKSKPQKEQAAAIIEAVTVDEKGNRILDDGEALKLNYRDFIKLSAKSQELNGLDDEAVEKN